MSRKIALLAIAALGCGAQDAAAIFEQHCLSCHSPAVKLSGLDLSTREAALKGGTKGPALVPGSPQASLLLRAVEQTGPLKMPPGKVLPPGEIARLRDWIAGGAPWKSAAASAVWWSFQKPKRPAGAHTIDSFLDAALRAKGLQPLPAASRAALIRRVTYDLTGLPPTFAEVNQFVADTSPDAWPRLIDRLLDSPHYGEKWGRFWLDLVRYSDTAGFELDSYIPDAWRYRDYVVAAFQNDKPYDRFIREQLAGDEFWPEDPPSVSGTGYFCVGPNRDLYPDQSDINRVESLTDYVDTTAAVFQGLTLGCARCHDHKYDPLPQRDYYRFQAFFAPLVKTKVALNRLSSLGFDVAENVREIKLRDIGEEIGAIQERCRKVHRKDEEIRACLTPEENERLQGVERRLLSMFAGYRSKPFACGVMDAGNHSPRTYLPVKGERLGTPVEPGWLSVLGGGEVPAAPDFRDATGPIPLGPTTGRRKALADWIASPDNPLTARVMVNRIWQGHFGRGLVATPSDFGRRGSPPSHPELLDWLASEFVEKRWSIKAMHRLILTSAAYRRQAAAPDADKDPQNVYLSRFPRRRLQSEEMRDAVLAATGRLNRAIGGKPVIPPLSAEELRGMTQRLDSAWPVTFDKAGYNRRSLYLLQKRTFRLPVMEVFDAPESMLTCARRDASTTPTQSLTWLNGGFILEQAGALAAELESASAIDLAFERVLLRRPSPAEKSRAEAFLKTQTENTGSHLAAVTELIRGLLNLNEFLYVD